MQHITPPNMTQFGFCVLTQTTKLPTTLEELTSQITNKIPEVLGEFVVKRISNEWTDVFTLDQFPAERIYLQTYQQLLLAVLQYLEGQVGSFGMVLEVESNLYDYRIIGTVYSIPEGTSHGEQS